jgi:hypothetical protein
LIQISAIFTSSGPALSAEYAALLASCTDAKIPRFRNHATDFQLPTLIPPRDVDCFYLRKDPLSRVIASPLVRIWAIIRDARFRQVDGWALALHLRTRLEPKTLTLQPKRLPGNMQAGCVIMNDPNTGASMLDSLLHTPACHS